MDKIKHLPSSPGVYLFKNEDGTVLYIGKAKALKKRVSSYFKPSDDWKVNALVSELDEVAFIITKNEHEALLLEATLIQEHKPKFNVLLKSGNPFVYLFFSQHRPPQLSLVRNKREKGTYFGPFLQKNDARRVFMYLLKTFKLKRCNKKIPGGCLDYHLDLCAGSCTGTFDVEDYSFRANLAIRALEANHSSFLTSLKERITEHNGRLEFEKSRNLYEYLNNFNTIFSTLKTHFTEQKYRHETAIATANKSWTGKKNPDLATQLQQFLGLEKPIHTIDCFDISHFQSNAIVGSCVRFTDGIPEKNRFRRFKIKTLQQQNDYAALQEIVARRYRNVQELPDLVLIDGGKGQLNAVLHIIAETPCISLAKREETIFGPQFPQGIKLDLHDEHAKLLIALRDYAHHFAITYHRTVRSNSQW